MDCDLNEWQCATAVQLRFNDIDTLGHVNNSVYFELFDLGKTDYFTRAAGDSIDWEQIPIMLVNVNCDFMAQTRYHEPLEVVTRLERIGNSSITLLQALRNSHTGEVKSLCRSTSVYLDLTTSTPTTVPDHWRAALFSLS